MYVCIRGGPLRPLHRDPQWSITNIICFTYTTGAGIAVRYSDVMRAGRPGFDFPYGQATFLYFAASRPVLGPNNPTSAGVFFNRSKAAAA
jgi:hypothetical protein